MHDTLLFHWGVTLSCASKSWTYIVLTKDDPKASGHQHLISINWVDYVDRKVHLNKPSQKAMLELCVPKT
jgi:hypothetical protein